MDVFIEKELYNMSVTQIEATVEIQTIMSPA